MRHGRSRLVALGLVVALIGGGWWTWQHVVRAEGDCTVGVTGTAAMVHVSGAHADATCSQMVDGSTLGKEYHFTGQITVPVVCQYQFTGRTYTVYDEGILKIQGNALCTVLAENRVPVINPQGSP